MEKIKRKYKPCEGGRIEFRFKNKKDKLVTKTNLEIIRIKTGLKDDQILFKALEEFNNSYDSKGNKK